MSYRTELFAMSVKKLVLAKVIGGVERKFSYSHFQKNVRENFFTKIDKNCGNVRFNTNFK
jgi:hypothetical protein